MKLALVRIVALPYGDERTDHNTGKVYRRDKVYLKEDVDRFRSCVGAPVLYEDADQTPPLEPPTALRDFPAWLDGWIEFCLSPLAKDLGDPASIFRPCLQALRNAVEAMPKAPSPPDVRRVNHSKPTAVANEFKRYRDWVPTTNRDKRTKPTPVEALLGDDARRVFEIAHSDQSADDRAIAICRIDPNRFLLWNSPEWANLLSVSAAAVRKGKFWKEYRPKALEELRRE